MRRAFMCSRSFAQKAQYLSNHAIRNEAYCRLGYCFMHSRWFAFDVNLTPTSMLGRYNGDVDGDGEAGPRDSRRVCIA